MGRAPGVYRTIFNKKEGLTLYQTTCDLWLFIPSPFRTICKQLNPTRSTTSILLWLMISQDTQHYLINAKRMSNKTDIYWKIDLDAAYRQIHANYTTASTCIPKVDKIDFACLWLTFGITPAPEYYTTIRKLAIDLGNNILGNESWHTYNINSPHIILISEEDK